MDYNLIVTRVNGAQQTHTNAKLEVEDGEIEDTKMVDSQAKTTSEKAPATESSSGQDATTGHGPGGTVEEQNKTLAQEDTGENKREDQSSKPADSVSAPQPSGTIPQDTPGPGAPKSPPSSRTTRKPSPEAPNPPNIPKRPEFDSRSPSTPEIRPQPNLPNKPEPLRPFRPIEGRGSQRPPETVERQESRDRNHGYHPGRQSFVERDRAFDHHRPDDRSQKTESLREREVPPRRPSEEDHHSRPSSRGPHPRPSRESERFDRPAKERQSHSDYFQPRQEYKDDDVHPSRLAYITSGHDRGNPPRESPRGPSHAERPELMRPDRGDRKVYSGRPPSPSRTEDRRSSNRADRRDERDSRRSTNFPPPPRRDELPTGPRSDRHNYPVSNDANHSLELRDSRPAQTLPSPDPAYGRLNQDPRYPARSQDPFDRPQDIPSGPRRSIPARGNRNTSTPQSNAPSQQQQGSPVRNLERQPPSGPSNRSSIRDNAQQDNNASAPNSAPSLGSLDTSGIHPDRLKALQSPVESGFGSDGLRSQPPSSPAAIAPPSGPRSAGHPPAGPSPTTRGSGSASAFPGERNRGDKRFAGINNMLQQSSGASADRSGQGTSIRGRATGRQGGSSANAPSPQSTRPQTPVGSRSDNTPGSTAQHPGSGRPDLFAGRSNGSSQQAQEDSRGAGRAGRRSEIMEEAASESRRSPRHSSGGRTPDERDRDRDRERERDRDRDRDRERERDRDAGRRNEDDARSSGSKRDEHRERARDADRERDRSRVGDVHGRDQSRDVRDFPRRETQSSSARDSGSSSRRRDRRDRDEGPEGRPKRGSSPHGLPPIPPPPPPLDERRWGRNDDRTRDRDRDRDRERERDRNAGGAPIPPRGGNGAGTWPRKRGRGAGNIEDGYDGGMRVGGENKRFRRGN